MKKTKILISDWRKLWKCSTVFLLFLALQLQSCEKPYDTSVVHDGRVLLYDGPAIAIEDDIDESFLRPSSGVRVFISYCTWSTGVLNPRCIPEGRIKETGITDSEGNYTVSFNGDQSKVYTAEIDNTTEFVQRSSSRSKNSYREIILIPRSLIR